MGKRVNLVYDNGKRQIALLCFLIDEDNDEFMKDGEPIEVRDVFDGSDTSVIFYDEEVGLFGVPVDKIVYIESLE